MSGITGAIWTDAERAVDDALLKRMTESLAHRGPDEEGTYCSEFRLRPPYEPLPGVALGHRRLAVSDATAGRQPLSNEDGTVWVVCDGAVHNFPQLRQRLEGSGHGFRTRSEAEAIAHLYEDEGPDCFAHLVGTFAIAIWDAQRRRLVLGRDRLGEKPLVYRHEAGRLLFASELKSLLQVPDVPRKIDRGSLDEYLTYGYVPHPNTIFRGIRKLPPGHRLVCQDDRLDVQAYWTPDFARVRKRQPAEDARQLRSLLEESLRGQLRADADAPPGVWLSSEAQSSLIAALVQSYRDDPVKTFGVGFSNGLSEEASFARGVAAHVGSEHQEISMDFGGGDELAQLASHLDEPFADASTLAAFRAARQIREHVKVALTGEGGSVLFGGLPRYRAAKLAAWVDRTPSQLRWPLVCGCWQSLPASRRWKQFSRALGNPPARRYLDWVGIFDEQRRVELYSEDALAALPDSDPFGFLHRAWQHSRGRDAAATAANADLITQLPCRLLTRLDLAPMASGLECRQPFLDHRVVEFALALPSSRRFGTRRRKSLLRQAFGDLLPNWAWKRRAPRPAAPLAEWLRGPLKEMCRETLLARRARERGFFHAGAVERMLDEHQRRSFDHGAQLWALLVLELWMGARVDQPATSPAAGEVG